MSNKGILVLFAGAGLPVRSWEEYIFAECDKKFKKRAESRRFPADLDIAREKFIRRMHVWKDDEPGKNLMTVDAEYYFGDSIFKLTRLVSPVFHSFPATYHLI